MNMRIFFDTSDFEKCDQKQFFRHDSDFELVDDSRIASRDSGNLICAAKVDDCSFKPTFFCDEAY